MDELEEVNDGIQHPGAHRRKGKPAREGYTSNSIPSSSTFFAAKTMSNAKPAKSDTDSIEAVITCPISYALFLEPVKLLLEGNYDGGPIIEKEMAINIMRKGPAQCPITRQNIAGYVRIREIEVLVEDYLINYPEKKINQYQKETPIETPHDIEAPHDVEAPHETNFKQFYLLMFVIFSMQLTVSTNTLGAVIMMNVTDSDRVGIINPKEVALSSLAGVATLYTSVGALLALYFPQQLEHLIETTLDPNVVGNTQLRLWRYGLLDSPDARIQVVKISLYACLLSGLLGSAMCGFKNATLLHAGLSSFMGLLAPTLVESTTWVAEIAYERYTHRR